MKKTLSLILASLCVLLAGCGETEKEKTDNKTTTTTTAAPNTTTTTTTTTTSATEAAAPAESDAGSDDNNKVDICKLVDPDASRFIKIGEDSDGGFQFLIFMRYIGDKAVKNYTFNYIMYTEDYSEALDTATGKNTVSVKIEKPVKTGEYLWDISRETPHMYCKDCEHFLLDSLEIEYEDGTKNTFECHREFENFPGSNSLESSWNGWIKSLKEKYTDLPIS